LNSHQTKFLLKRDSGIQDTTDSDERPSKKQRRHGGHGLNDNKHPLKKRLHSLSRNKDNTRLGQMQQEIILVKESFKRIEADVQEVIITLRELLCEIQGLRHREE
jgi:hypothetical protein